MNTISLLDSVSEIIDNRGKTCPTSEYGIALIATNCVKSSNLFPTKERIRYVNQHTFDNWFRGHPQPGDIMFVNKGSPGEVCLVPNEVDFCFAQDMVALRANKEKIDPLYFFAVLRSQKVKKMIQNMHVGTMIPHFKKTDFKKIDLPLPSRKIQEFIGNYYYSCSKKIHLNKKSNQNLEKIVKTIFKSWFVNFDPVKAKAAGKPSGLPKEINDLFPDSFEDSKIGKIPKGWKMGKIEEIAKKISEKYKKEDNWSEERLIDLSRMPSNSISLNSFGKGEELSTSVCRFRKYDFLFGSIRPYFYKSGICPFDGVSNTSVFILRGINMFDREFLYFYSSNDITFKKSIQYSNGTKMPIISWKDFKEFCFALPNEELRKYFSKITKPIVEKIIYNIEEQEILEKMRDKILPKLISGELKISNVNKII